MIQTPKIDHIKFIVPEVIDEVVALSEPTIENVTALDVLRDAVADGGVLSAIWDGRPAFRSKINTGDLITGDNSTFDSDTGDWTREAGISLAGGSLSFDAITGVKSASITIPLATGDYEVIFIISDRNAGSVTPIVGGTIGTTRSTNDTFTETVTGGGTTLFEFEGVDGTDLKVNIVTIRLKDEWRIDAALERRPVPPGINGAMLVNHNLPEAYASSMARIVEWFAAATDSLPSTPIEPVKTLSGLLGKNEPYLSIDTAGKITVSDDVNMNIGAGDFTIIYRMRIPLPIVSSFGIGKGAGTGTSEGYEVIFRENGNMEMYVSDGTSYVINTGGAGTLGAFSTDEIFEVAWVFYRSGLLIQYYNGVKQGSVDISSAEGALINGTSDFIIDRATQNNIDFYGGNIYNRALAPQEIEQHSSYPKGGAPRPLFIGTNVVIGVNNLWENDTMDTFDNTGGDITVTSSAGSQLCLLKNSDMIAPVTIGHRYRLTYDVTIRSGSFRMTVGGTNQVIDLINRTEIGRTADFLASGTSVSTGGFLIVSVGGSDDGDFTNIWLTDLDTLTQFPLSVDRWATKVGVTNGDMEDNDGTTAANWFVEAAGTPSIVTGNGFTGDAQRIVHSGTSFPSIRTTSTYFVPGVKYRLSFKYRTDSNAFRVRFRSSPFTIIVDPPVNTGNAIALSVEFVAGTTDLIQFMLHPGSVGEYFEIDEVRVDTLGAVFSLAPAGINKTGLIWYDDSDNALNGVITSGVDFWNVPDADNNGFFFQQFSATVLRYLFANFNPDILSGESANTLLGWLMWGRVYDIALVNEAGYSAALRWPGVIMGESDAGVILTERKYGSRPGWALTLFPQDQTAWDLTQEMLDRVQGSLHPFYVIFDYSNSGPVMWQVRLDGEVPFTYITGEPNVDGIQINLIAEGV